MTAVVAVDLGKTGCRALLLEGVGPTGDVHEVAGAPGLAAKDGVHTARAAVLSAVRPLLEGKLDPKLVTVCVGAAGAATAPEAARTMARLLLRDLPTAEVAVTSDAITAHAGALGGDTGVVLAIGTGAVAVGIGEGGDFARVDGWGPWLGDTGSGAWLGLAGLRASVRAHDGRGPGTALLAAAVERFGAVDRWPAAVTGDGNSARTAASFAPDIARLAAEGDEVAGAILQEAAAELAESVMAASRPLGDGTVDIALTGGLVGLGAPLMTPLRSALATFARPVRLRDALGTPLDGSRLLARSTSLPHESHVVRVRRDTPSDLDPVLPATPAAVSY
ncbi:N-acetylglucosamine kinase [Streptomyces bauhiniae]|uniref:N-acetylglucosamine kinase n=1 Tax=Streptomyces bauhiniae TaxID=2340725 RepID=UPI0035D6691E